MAILISLLLLKLGGGPWIGVEIPGGNIACNGLINCNGKPVWIDGSLFNASVFTTINNIQITLGHKCAYLNGKTVS